MTSCKICRVEYQQKRMGQKTCGDPICRKEYQRQVQIRKDELKELRKRKEAIKPLSKWKKEAQVEFNRWIRARDVSQPCISCGAMDRTAWDAGHYRSVGAAPGLRFNEDNCHRQCIPCNKFKSGNAIEYRIRLIQRIGVEKVESLEADNDPKKYTVADCQEIITEYRGRIKREKG